MADRIGLGPVFRARVVLQGQGLGLGLDTVRRIVLANAGRISAESRPGRTEFRVSLPVAE